MAAGDLVVLTGATGHVGFATLRALINQGYTVRAVVRSDAKGDSVRNQSTLKTKPDQLSFVTVPDFTVPNAFDAAVHGAKYIVHVASPLADSVPPGADLEAGIVKPAVQGTLNVFSAAKASGTVKRIVVTSSAVVTVPLNVILGAPTSETYHPDFRAPPIPAPYMDMPIVAYVASKIAAINAAEDFVKAEKPDFDVIHIHPSFVEGRDDLTTTVKGFETGTNKIITDLVTGDKAEEPRLAAAVHVEDVALAHVKALDSSVPGNRSFVLNRSDFAWEDALQIIKEKYPEALAKGWLSTEGALVSPAHVNVDSSETETILGVKFRTYKEMVESVVEQYLEVLEKEDGGN